MTITPERLAELTELSKGDSDTLLNRCDLRTLLSLLAKKDAEVGRLTEEKRCLAGFVNDIGPERDSLRARLTAIESIHRRMIIETPQDDEFTSLIGDALREGDPR